MVQFGQCIPALLSILLACSQPKHYLHPGQSQSDKVQKLSSFGASSSSFEPNSSVSQSRRHALASLATAALVVPQPSIAAAIDPRAIIKVQLNSPQERLGLELYETSIGTPPRNVVAVKNIVLATPQNAKLKPGMILVKASETPVSNARTIVEQLRQGPYPIVLEFCNLAAVGDAYGDDGKPMVTALDALKLAESNTGQPVEDRSSSTTLFRQETLKQPSSSCAIQSRRGDVLEIRYTARYGGEAGPVFDSSLQRGTGQPYQMVLGSGDMIPGVDQGLYDMCPGEVRALTIPPRLGYGPRARQLYRIPDNTSLYWTVELVTVNFIKEGDNTRDREELEGRVPY